MPKCTHRQINRILSRTFSSRVNICTSIWEGVTPSEWHCIYENAERIESCPFQSWESDRVPTQSSVTPAGSSSSNLTMLNLSKKCWIKKMLLIVRDTELFPLISILMKIQLTRKSTWRGTEREREKNRVWRYVHMNLLRLDNFFLSTSISRIWTISSASFQKRKYTPFSNIVEKQSKWKGRRRE